MWFMHPITLFFAKFGNNKFDEAWSYHNKPFKVHVAVKEMINPRDEMDTIITQEYKKNQEMPNKKEKGLKGNVENFWNKKKREWADTPKNKVNELKQDIDKFINKNTCQEYMMLN